MPRLKSLLRNLFRKNRVESELQREAESFVELLTREKVAAGMAPEEARRAALVEFGGVEQVKQQVREARAGGWLEPLGQDVRYGLRVLRKSPGFAIVAVLTLALGIGVSTAIFSVVDTVLFRPLPYFEPDRLVAVYEGSAGRTVIAWSELAAFAERSRHLEAVAGIQPVSATILGGDQPEQVSGALVSASFFPMLGVGTIYGRHFLPEEDHAGAGQVMLVSEGLWRTRYGADPTLVGRNLTLEVNENWGRQVQRSQSYTVVGIVPSSFQTLLPGTLGEVWFPLAATAYDSHDLFVVGRMKPGVTPAQVRSELQTLADPLRSTVHSDGRAMQFQVLPVLQDLLGDWKRGLLILLGAVGFVVLIACVNVANLYLARGQARQHEMAVRAALGAGRRRLIRQMLTESLLVALLGGALAALAAGWGIKLIAALSTEDLPRLGQAQFDLRVFGFLGSVVLLATIVSGLAPALRLSRINATAGLREAGRSAGERRGSLRARGILVVAEVGLAVILLIGGGLMIRSLIGLLRASPGFDPDNVLTLRISLPRHAYQNAGQRAVFYDKVLPRIASLPGVQHAGVNSAIPFGGPFTGIRVNSQSVPEGVDAQWRLASPEFFDALKIPLLAGRRFEAGEMRGPLQSALIDQSMAQSLWPAEDPVGKQIVLSDNPPMVVVGVVGKIRDASLSGDTIPIVYLPLYPRAGVLAVRSASDPMPLLPTIRRILAEADPAVAPSDIRLMQERIESTFSLQRFTTVLLGIFAGAALFLGVIGLYGVISFSVSQRRQEIGVRMALGAQPRDVLRLVLGQGMKMALLGAAAGLAAAFGLTQLLSALLYEVSTTDALTFVVVPVVLLAVTLGACLVPARRALRVDPVVALRNE